MFAAYTNLDTENQIRAVVTEAVKLHTGSSI